VRTRTLTLGWQQRSVPLAVLDITRENPQHPLVRALKHESDEKRFADWSHILLDQAVLAERGQLDEPGAFVKRLNGLMLARAGKGPRIWTPRG
jgi:HSP90 family molecular chaperone